MSKLQGIDEEGERWKDRGLWSKDEMLKFLKIKELDSPLDSDHPVLGVGPREGGRTASCVPKSPMNVERD